MSAGNLSAADALIGGRIVARTKLQYQSKIRAIEKYYRDQLHRDFTIPVDRNDILAFFGWLIDVQHKDRPLAISSVHLYKSALGWYYKERKLIMDLTVNQELDQCCTRHTRRAEYSAEYSKFEQSSRGAEYSLHD
jgi:hypothetical protein